MFKVGDRVTAGERYAGQWQDLVVVRVGPYGIIVQKPSGLEGAFSIDELTLIYDYNTEDLEFDV